MFGRAVSVLGVLGVLVVGGCGTSSLPADGGNEVTVDVDVAVDDAANDPAGEEASASCSPDGSTRAIPCGLCGGMQSQICAGGMWYDESACSAGSDCAPGAIDTQVCGTSGCGTAQRICFSSCTFGPWSACAEPPGAVCVAGTMEDTRLDCPPGQIQRRRCDSTTCTWTAIRPCSTDCLDSPMGVGTDAEEICIPGGDANIGGADPTSTADDPLHVVTLYPYLIGRFKVSNGLYRACVAAGACTDPVYVDPSYATYDRHPVFGLIWAQADAFCAWEGKRLPTEAEWEKAARGPYPLQSYYAWGDWLPTCAEADLTGCLADMGDIDAFPGGASPYGVERTNEGVDEWVADLWDPAYYSVSPMVDPRGPTIGPYHTARSAGWGGRPQDVPAITSRWDARDAGVRCARSVEAR